MSVNISAVCVVAKRSNGRVVDARLFECVGSGPRGPRDPRAPDRDKPAAVRRHASSLAQGAAFPTTYTQDFQMLVDMPNHIIN